MKLTVLIVCLALLSVVVFARDLSSVARRERARRQTIREHSTTFTNADLDAYAVHQNVETRTKKTPLPPITERDLKKEERFWLKENARHERELARLDANIRRLEWRLRDRRVKTREGRLREDPAVTLIEENLESWREQREEMVVDFRERARKARAFPGWLR